MIFLTYPIALSIVLFSIGLAGIATDRHLVVIMLAVELIFVASIIALVSFFSYGSQSNPDAVLMLFAIFTVAAVEIITVITFYVYMKRSGIEFDVAKLSRLKW
jgi:NADH-quinone oxidoreductase subunit K